MVTPSKLPQRVLERIRSSISERTGLAPQDWVLEARVRERMRALGLRDVARYADALTSPAELTGLIELLRVGETRFFRHESQMRAVTEMVLPHLRNQKGTAKVWSAGCATGEEAYTLAMLLSRGLEGCRDVQILASDISPASLRQAREGLYRESALGAMPRVYREELEAAKDGHFRVPARLRSLVEFEERNLAKGPFPGSFDLIFCRNVLIYFDEAAKNLALERLVKALKPGAFLFLGYSESLRDVSGLEVVKEGECHVYRRKLPSTPTGSRPPHTPEPAVRTPIPGATSTQVSLRGEYRNGTRLAEELDRALAAKCGLITIDLDGADFLSQETADVLRAMRAKAQAQGVSLHWRATREGHLRFLRRHKLLEGGQ